MRPTFILGLILAYTFTVGAQTQLKPLENDFRNQRNVEVIEQTPMVASIQKGAKQVFQANVRVDMPQNMLDSIVQGDDIVVQLDSIIYKNERGRAYSKTYYTYIRTFETKTIIKEVYELTDSLWTKTSKVTSVGNQYNNMLFSESLAYNNEGSITSGSKREYIWDVNANDDWTCLQTVYTYSPNAPELWVATFRMDDVFHGHSIVYKSSEQFQLNYNTNELEPTSRFEQLLNEDGFDLITAYYNWNANLQNWYGTDKSGYNYESNDNATSTVTYLWNDTEHLWGNKLVTTYNYLGYIVTEYLWNANTWVPVSQTGDENGDTVHYILVNGEFIRNYKSGIVDYGDNKFLYRDYLWDGSKWVLTSYNNESYDEQGNLLQRMKHTYNMQGYSTSYEQLYRESANDSWVVSWSYLQEYEYNDEGEETKYAVSYYGETDFEPYFKRETNRVNGRIYYIETSYWNGSSWDVDSRGDYFYSAVKQEIVVQEDEPVNQNGAGSIGLGLSLPTNTSITAGSFSLTLAAGIGIDPEQTKLAPALEDRYSLSITENQNGTWDFAIAPKAVAYANRVLQNFTYQQIISIAYIVPIGTDIGTYEAIVSNVKFEFEDETQIIVDEIPLEIVVDKVINGTIQHMANNIAIYPNPTLDHLTITNAEGVTLIVHNSVGMKIMEKNLSNNSEIINTSNWDEGLHILTLTDKKSEKGRMKIVKK